MAERRNGKAYGRTARGLRMAGAAGIILLVSLLCGGNSFAAEMQNASLGVSPPSISLGQLRTGQTLGFEITVFNAGDMPINLNLGVTDFTKDEQGKLIPIEGSTDAFFAMSAWITLPAERSFSLGPAERRDIQFRLTVPQRVEPGEKSCAISFITDPQQQGNVVIYNEVLAQVFAMVGEAARTGAAGEIQSLKKNGTFSSECSYSAMVKNTGNVHLLLDDVRLCFYRHGKLAHAEQLPQLLLLPEVPGQAPGYRILEGKVDLPDEWAGYEARLEIPSQSVSSAPSTIGVFPLWLLLTVIGSLAGAYALITWIVIGKAHHAHRRRMRRLEANLPIY